MTSSRGNRGYTSHTVYRIGGFLSILTETRSARSLSEIVQVRGDHGYYDDIMILRI